MDMTVCGRKEGGKGACVMWFGGVGCTVYWRWVSCGRRGGCGFFFFFQAEDGILDTSVTGVQTCALPILPHPTAMQSLLQARSDVTAHFGSPPYQSEELKQPGMHTILNSYDVWGGPQTFILAWTSSKRSEERRVGKECRARWARGRGRGKR